MESSDKNKKKDNTGFDFLGIGGLLKRVEKIVDMAGILEQEKTIHEEGEISFGHAGKDVKGVFGLTIRTVTGDSPKVEIFGNIRKTPEGPVVDEEREPISDLFDEEEEWVIVVEMPGIDEKDIKIDLREDIVVVFASSKHRKYRTELLLPTKVTNADLTTKYNNGVLEIRIKK